jgi:hypothetical protein
MELPIEFPVTEEEMSSLCRILGCRQEELANVLSCHATAAIREYIDMYLGKKSFTRGTDIREYRLMLLIKAAFNNTIPDEQEVSHLFQTTTTESRSLIRSAMSKYQYDLTDAIIMSLRELLRTAKQDADDKTGPYSVVINSQNLIDEMNRLLSDIDGSLPPISKSRGSVSTYHILPSSYQALTRHFSALLTGQ